MKSLARRYLARTPAGMILAIMLHPTRRLDRGKRVAASGCSFCGRSYPEIERLIAGPNGVAICNRCIRLGEQILIEEGIPSV
jgi:hypothetical protein